MKYQNDFRGVLKMNGEFLLGVDIGTYSSKGVLVAKEGKIIAQHTVFHDMAMPYPGQFEHDADKIWWSDFVTITKALLQQSKIHPSRIISVGISGIGPCVLPIDENGIPLRPAILYGIDRRSTKEIKYLERVLGKEQIFQKTGSYLSSQSAGPKILWIREHEREVYEKTRWFLTSQAYIVYKLTGITSIDIYTASSYAPLFDITSLQWDENASSYIVPVNRLPQVYWSYEVVGTITKQSAQETGLVHGTPVIVGTSDAAAEALSTGMLINDMMLMFGSSVFFIVQTSQLKKAKHFWNAPFLDKGIYSVLGGMSTAGSLTKWFRDNFAMEKEIEQENTYEILMKLAEKSPPGAKGLILLPYFEGERTPIHDPQAKGVLFGLNLQHTRSDIYRAILEGVGFGIYHNLEVLSEEMIEPQNILVTGGGTKNKLWMQIVSDILNKEIVIPDTKTGASYGDAFMAGVGSGLFHNLTDIHLWIKNKQVIQPDPKAHEKYLSSYHIFRSLYKVTKTLMHKI